MIGKKLGILFLLFGFFLRAYLAITTSIDFFDIGLLYDAFWLLAVIGFITLIPNRHSQRLITVLVFGFFTVITIVNQMYYEYFKTLVTKNNIQGFLFVSADTLTEEYALKIPLSAFGLIIIFSVLIIFLYRSSLKSSFSKNTLIVSILSLTLITVPIIRFNYVKFENNLDYFASDAYLFQSFEDFIQLSNRFGYFVYHTIDILNLSSAVAIEEIHDLTQTFLDAHSARKPNDTSNLFARSNLVIITVETLDTRFIHPDLTPNLYRLMNEGYQFPNFYVPTYFQGATCNTEFMALTSLYAINSNPKINNVCTSYATHNYPYALPNQLKNIGYKTTYFHSGEATFYNRDQLMPNLGFDYVYFNNSLDNMINPRHDTDLAVLIETFMDYSTPFYMHVLTYAMHGAYNQDDYDQYQPILELVYPELDKHDEIAVYYKKLIDFDNFLALLIAQLKENNVFDETLILIHSDHYPYMMNNQTLSTYLGVPVNDIDIYKQNLIMYHPSMQPNVFTDIWSTIDLTPTLLNLLHEEANFDYFLGTDYFTSTYKTVLFHNHIMTDGNIIISRTTPTKNTQLEEAQLKSLIAYELTKAWLESGNYWTFSNNP